MNRETFRRLQRIPGLQATLNPYKNLPELPWQLHFEHRGERFVLYEKPEPYEEAPHHKQALIVLEHKLTELVLQQRPDPARLDVRPGWEHWLELAEGVLSAPRQPAENSLHAALALEAWLQPEHITVQAAEEIEMGAPVALKDGKAHQIRPPLPPEIDWIRQLAEGHLVFVDEAGEDTSHQTMGLLVGCLTDHAMHGRLTADQMEQAVRHVQRFYEQHPEVQGESEVIPWETFRANAQRLIGKTPRAYRLVAQLVPVD